jgi:uncharacterized protein involved in exopolysaccharide biosynthesis
VIQNLEITKMQRAQEEPIIEIIDAPILPLGMEKFGQVKGIAIGGFLAGIIIIGWLFFKRFYREAMIN